MWPPKAWPLAPEETPSGGFDGPPVGTLTSVTGRQTTGGGVISAPAWGVVSSMRGGDGAPSANSDPPPEIPEDAFFAEAANGEDRVSEVGIPPLGGAPVAVLPGGETEEMSFGPPKTAAFSCLAVSDLVLSAEGAGVPVPSEDTSFGGLSITLSDGVDGSGPFQPGGATTSTKL